MKRFLRVGASAANVGGASSNDLASGGGGGQSSSSRAAEPGEEPGPPGGGGGQSSSSRAESCVDLEVSSNSSGEDVGAATRPEGVDVKWAQLPESGPLARWRGARAQTSACCTTMQRQRLHVVAYRTCVPEMPVSAVQNAIPILSEYGTSFSTPSGTLLCSG